MTTEQTDNQERLESTLGEVLRRTREAKRKTIEEAAEATRIHGNFLRALEEDDFDRLPAQVFIRGFIRLYATYLGLDPDDTFKHYIAQEGLQVKETPVKQYQSDVIDDEIMDRTSIFIKRKKSKILPVTILLLILILFYILGVLFKADDRYSELPIATEITIPETDAPVPPPPADPGESAKSDRAPLDPASPAGNAAEPPPPVKSPRFSKREAPENASPPAAAEPVTAPEPAMEPAAGPDIPAPPPRRVLPVTVKVATEEPPPAAQNGGEPEFD